MTCRDTLQCVHEPFGDAFYFGPERLSARYEADEQGRAASGFHESTYQTVLDRLEREGAKVRLISFIHFRLHHLRLVQVFSASDALILGCSHTLKHGTF